MFAQIHVSHAAVEVKAVLRRQPRLDTVLERQAQTALQGEDKKLDCEEAGVEVWGWWTGQSFIDTHEPFSA